MSCASCRTVSASRPFATSAALLTSSCAAESNCAASFLLHTSRRDSLALPLLHCRTFGGESSICCLRFRFLNDVTLRHLTFLGHVWELSRQAEELFEDMRLRNEK